MFSHETNKWVARIKNKEKAERREQKQVNKKKKMFKTKRKGGENGMTECASLK